MVHNYSYEDFYKRLDKHIAAAEAFSQNKDLNFIIKSCRLKPSKFLLDSKTFEDSFYIDKLWIDEEGNGLKLTNSNIEVVPQCTQFINMKIISTDIYKFRNINENLKLAQTVIILRDSTKEYLFLFLKNQMFQYYVLSDNQIDYSFSPLMLNIDFLSLFKSEVNSIKDIKLININNALTQERVLKGFMFNPFNLNIKTLLSKKGFKWAEKLKEIG